MKRKRIDFKIGKVEKKRKLDHYSDVPDFKELCRKYPEFAKHVNNGKLDYTNPESIIVLTKTILLDKFNVNFDFPNSKFLCPRVPNRLNYIHFVKKLLTISGEEMEGRNVWGVDIGTGASSIYALLGKSVFNWNFVGTDIDEEALKIAKNIVQSNGHEYEKSIELVLVRNPKEILRPNILPMNRQYHFCLCNPPFFANMKEGERNHPRRVCNATSSELVTEGGEIEFIKKIIDDSIVLKNRIKWYSSMIGRSSSLVPILDYLRSKNILNFITSEFHQGKIIRYCVAWNFFHPRPIWMNCNVFSLSIQRCYKPQHIMVNQVKDEIRNFSKLSVGINEEKSLGSEIELKLPKSEEIIRLKISQGAIRYSFELEIKSNLDFVTYAFQDICEHFSSLFKR